jgi:hypothetical protein
MLIFRPVSALLLALPLLATAGNVYKWVDAQGQVHYGQTPPDGVKAINQSGAKPGVTTEAPPAPKVEVAAEPAAKPAEKPAESAEDKAKRCSAAKDRIAFLEEKTARRLSVKQADGTDARMTDEEFEARLNKAKQEASGSCGK